MLPANYDVICTATSVMLSCNKKVNYPVLKLFVSPRLSNEIIDPVAFVLLENGLYQEGRTDLVVFCK